MVELQKRVLQGTADGPHLLITGGVHGDEFEPMPAIRRLFREVDPASLRGKLTLVPIVNEAAFLRGPIQARGYHFFHADGTPRLLLSTRLSCHLEAPQVWQDAIRYLAAHRINRSDVVNDPTVKIDAVGQWFAAFEQVSDTLVRSIAAG